MSVTKTSLGSMAGDDRGIHESHIQGIVHPMVGVCLIIVASLLAALSTPRDYSNATSLRLPALILAAGLLAIPIITVFARPIAILRIEQLLMVGFVYWLLLDLIQGSFVVHGVERSHVQLGFLCIGVMACGVWCGQLIRPMAMPKTIVRSLGVKLSAQTLMALAFVCFGLSM